MGAVFLNPDHAISAVLAADPFKSRRAADFGGLRAVSLELGRLLAARKSLIAETVFANEAYFVTSPDPACQGVRVCGANSSSLASLRSRKPSNASPPGSRRRL